MMIFRPQGLVAAKSHLLTYSRLIGDKVKELQAVRGGSGHAAESASVWRARPADPPVTGVVPTDARDGGDK